MRLGRAVVACALVAGSCAGSGSDSGAPTSISISTSSVEVGTTIGEVASAETTSTSTASEVPDVPVEPDAIASPAGPASLASGIVAYGNLGLEPVRRKNDRSFVPVATRIQVSSPDGNGMVTVTGSAGAVPYGDPELPWGYVDVIAVEWGTQDCVERRSDGSFSALLEAAAGSTLYVLPIESGMCTGQGIQTGPAAVLEVPGPGAATTLGRAGDSLKWSAVGSLAGSDRQIQFTVHDGAGDQCLVPRIHLYRLFDGQGAYLTQVNVNVHGPVLTPTGLPIESNDGSNGYYETVEFVDAPECLQSSLTLTTAALPASLASGWYLPRIVFGEANPGGTLEFGSGTNFPGSDGLNFEGNTGFGYLPLVGVGTTAQPRLPATLLNEAPSWAAAGSSSGVGGRSTVRSSPHPPTRCPGKQSTTRWSPTSRPSATRDSPPPCPSPSSGWTPTSRETSRSR
jgi:hypothetical protein